MTLWIGRWFGCRGTRPQAKDLGHATLGRGVAQLLPALDGAIEEGAQVVAPDRLPESSRPMLVDVHHARFAFETCSGGRDGQEGDIVGAQAAQAEGQAAQIAVTEGVID